MASARYSIGIDLGTTNSAMAFAPLDGDAPTEVFAIPQWQSVTSVQPAPTLPSFLYLPDEQTAALLGGRAAGAGEWIVGRLARRKAGEVPGRVAHSAKSWLCHHAADRSAPFLPWASEDLPEGRKLSPLAASALILRYLRGVWDDRFAPSGRDFAFDAQQITVTVPASFDAAAQQLTLDAAAEAAFPAQVRLLEEPQAAFYHWLDQADSGGVLDAMRADGGGGAVHVLVVDVGGGTSDFSLFELNPGVGAPAITRTAVSDHILLGGDNIDLALAHRVEPQLIGDGERLSRGQWDHLVARCRDVKEQALSGDGAGEGTGDETFAVAIPSRGAGLMTGSAAVRLSRGDVDSVVMEGFFPFCAADDRPRRTLGALKEWGLPFAADSRVSRHLADFLSSRPPVDALLCNGGTLNPGRLRRRLVEQINRWQGRAPRLLDNHDPELAVARGAARFGERVHGRGRRIEADAARAVFLAVHRAGTEVDEGHDDSRPALVCVVPQGARAEDTFTVAGRGLALRVDRPVRFQTFTSTRHRRAKAGDVVAWRNNEFQTLPALATVATLDEDKAGGPAGADKVVPVSLSARINELGLLQVRCVSADPAIDRSWPLAFNLRPGRAEDGAQPLAPPDSATDRDETDAAPNAEPAALADAGAHIASAFQPPPSGRLEKVTAGKREKVTAGRLLTGLEKILERPKAGWNGPLLRALWPAVDAAMAGRTISVEREEAWLIVAGFVLRPGFGAPLDDARMDRLWRLRDLGLAFPGKRIKVQEHILWRRVGGGLSRERQEHLLRPELGRLLRQPGPAPELVLLAGSLERIGHETKTELAGRFIDLALERLAAGRHAAPVLTALSLLLNRAPLYAGPEAVASPDLVERAYRAFEGQDWGGAENVEMQTLFLRAARVVDSRSLDVAPSLRRRIADRLEKAGVPAARTARIRDFVPVTRDERSSLLGDSLPPGLILRG